MSKVAPPSSLQTWFTFVGNSMPTLEENPVTIIRKSDGKMIYDDAGELDWTDVYAWTFGDHRL